MTEPQHKLPKVNILLSTYNGAVYLQEQFDSIMTQEGETVLHVRDDGSSDNTCTMLEEYSTRHENLVVRGGQNLGVVNSFFDLMQHADTSCKYFAFCDQDDVWLSSKMAHAVELLEQEDNSIPQLYFCRLEYVNDSLEHMGYSPLAKRSGFGNALVQNLATGCTVVFNEAARQLILSKLPRRAMMHDWWLYLVVSAFGNIVYDDRVGIKYRQHNANEVGGTPHFIESMRRRLKRFVNHGKHVFRVSEQAVEFIRCHGDRLPASKKKTIQRFLDSKSSFFSRLRYTTNMDVHRNSILDDFILRVMILIDRY
ncbi:MAG: glycosyltransferase family 2 protein [Rhodothermales bacterium]